jgi:hypothetical protein
MGELNWWWMDQLYKKLLAKDFVSNQQKQTDLDIVALIIFINWAWQNTQFINLTFDVSRVDTVWLFRNEGYLEIASLVLFLTKISNNTAWNCWYLGFCYSDYELFVTSDWRSTWNICKCSIVWPDKGAGSLGQMISKVTGPGRFLHSSDQQDSISFKHWLQ